MHNGFVNIDNEKMSKSLGNFFTVREVLPKLRHPEVLRYFILSSHYRGPINYSLEQLEQAESALARIYTALRDLPAVPAGESEHVARFREVMDDDFNTPEAIAVLQTMTREINSAKAAGDQAKAAALGAEVRALGALLGLAQVDPAEWARLGVTLSDAAINERIAARLVARKGKSWAESDRIRDELAKAGVVLEDKPDGTTTWRRG
jgi:cysteinyl-tRNA synthetase